MSLPTKSFVVVDKDSNREHVFDTIWDARSKLVELVTLGVTAYMYIAKAYN